MTKTTNKPISETTDIIMSDAEMSNAEIFTLKFNDILARIIGCNNENIKLRINNRINEVFIMCKSVLDEYNEEFVNECYDAFMTQMNRVIYNDNDKLELKNIFHEYFRNEYP